MRSLAVSSLLLFVCGCHLVIHADDHLGPGLVHDGGVRDSAMRDASEIDADVVDTGVDSGSVCTTEPPSCGPRGLTGCTPTGCLSCPPRDIDATPFVRATPGESLDMPSAAFDVKIQSNAFGSWGLVAAGIGPAEQPPRLARIPLSPGATGAMPGLATLNGGWTSMTGFAFGTGDTSQALFEQGVADGASKHGIAMLLDLTQPSFDAIVLDATSFTAGRPSRVRVFSGGMASGSSENYFVWPITVGGTHQLHWRAESDAEGDTSLPSGDFNATPVHLAGSDGPHVLVQSVEVPSVTVIKELPDGPLNQVTLGATGLADWVHISDGRYLAAVPDGRDVKFMEVNTNTCTSICPTALQGRLSYSGLVRSARIVALQGAFAVATIADDGLGQRDVVLRVVDTDHHPVVSAASILAPDTTYDWLAAKVSAGTIDLALFGGGFTSNEQHVGIAWANAGGLSVPFLEAHFLVFEPCADALP